MAVNTIRLSDGTNKLLPESADSAAGYQKCADGTLIQWDSVTIASGSYVADVTFQLAFVDTNYKISLTAFDNGLSLNFTNKTIGGVKVGRTPNTSANGIDWVAVGRWK